ncbi:MAG: DNA polymerase I [Sphaerochaeta sp.]
MDRKKSLIIDGYGLIYRSYYGFINNPMRSANGENISAVYGFFATLLKLVREEKIDYLSVAMDTSGPTFRHDLYDLYKANRDKAPEDLHSQVPYITAILEALGIPVLEHSGWEADDIIASLAKEATDDGIQTIMFTGDKDLLQLVNDDVIALRPAKKGESFYRPMGKTEVEEEFGITPEQIIDFLALVGDSSDNVPGVRGIGQKGATKLLGEYKTLEGIYEHLEDHTPGLRKNLEEGREDAQLSRTLVTLDRSLYDGKGIEWKKYRVDTITWAESIPLFQELGMRTIIGELERLSGTTAPEVVEEESVGDQRTYTGVTDLTELKRLLDEAVKAGGVIAFDLETDSLIELDAAIIGFSFAWEEKRAYYVPLIHNNTPLLDEAKVCELLRSYLESGQLGVIGQNVKFDYKVLKARWNLSIKTIVADTMIAAWLLDATSLLNMDFLALRHLGIETVRYTDVVPKGKSLADIDVKEAIFYGAEDADITLQLWNVFEKLLKERKLYELLMNLELPLLKIIAHMELEGIYLDQGIIGPLGKEFAARIDEIKGQIFLLCGKEFNLNSPKQLQEVLFVERGIPTGAKTQTGFSTATDVLEPLSGQYPEVALILAYRMLNKLVSTYVEALPKQVNARTGRIHPTFQQTGTETGRLSCRDPNLQNIPVRTEEGRRIRSAFVPKEGYLFLSADYAQIELVVLAHMANDPGLKEAFGAGMDIHRFTASLIFDLPMLEVTSEMRAIAKTINFGVIYGMGTHALAQDLKIPYQDAKRFIDQYFERYPAVQSFIEKTKKQARKDEVVHTLFGHQRPVGSINSSNRNEQARAERVAVNTVIQGTAADIMKNAMLRVDTAMKERKLQSVLLLQIHDELIFEVPSAEIEEMKVLVKEALEGAANLAIPLTVSITVGADWGQL